jgi:hypothetical protein
MADGLGRFMAPGRHTRRQRPTRLRRVSVAMLIMLVVQYGLGIFLNLYVAVPASDAHAGIFQEISTAPLALTVHVLLGLALIGTAVLLVARAVGERDRMLALLATAGLTAIGGAFGAGEIFVKNGQAIASMAMAILTGVALLCYIGTLALARAAQGQATVPELVDDRVRTPRPRTPATPPAPWPAGENWPGELVAATDLNQVPGGQFPDVDRVALEPRPLGEHGGAGLDQQWNGEWR